MANNSATYYTAVSYNSLTGNKLLPPKTIQRRYNKKGPYATKLVVSAASRREYNGKVVDENMVVLRKRIQEMKITEANCNAPDEWMEWEKRYYCERYSTSDICQAVGLLQSLLINTRPSLALGMAALILLSVPLTVGVTFFHLVEVAKWVVAGIHLWIIKLFPSIILSFLHL